MSTSETHRRLAAILSADVAGYSRLMGADEEATIETLTAYRQVFLTHIERRHGRVVDAKGDAILAEFASVVDGVGAAVEIQRELAERNADLPDQRRMEFRIGINLGDVVVRDEAIYGDGVNVAARLEGLAEPGGICISGTAFDQVEGKLPLHYEPLGEQRVKNIARPVRAYMVRAAPAAAAKPGPPLPDQPSIAVLAFENLSGDAEQEYFADGISENIITRLAAIPELSVIARNSSFAYKGKAVDARQVGRELGVRYLLEGSVLRSDQNIRVTAQLIDTESGRHLWADRFDRELKELFAVLDEITLTVVTQLEIKLRLGDHARVIAHGTRSVAALDHQLRARELFMRLEPESNRSARELSRKATELDPDFAWALAQEGWTHITDVVFGWSGDPADSLRQAEALGRQALAADANNQFAYTLLARVHALRGEFDEAIAAGRRAVELSPDDSYPLSNLARIMQWAGRFEESLALIKKALRLQPYPDPTQLGFTGDAFYLLGQYGEAVPWYRRVLERARPGALVLLCWHFLIVSYVEIGEMEQAHAEAAKLLEAYPDFTIAAAAARIQALPFRDHAFMERHLADLRQAGLPE